MKVVLVALLQLLFSTSAFADILDFEGLPPAYMYLGGGQNVGSFYQGVTFGPSVTGLDLTGSIAFPPHSGSIVLWDPFDQDVTLLFSSPQTDVSFWYTSFDLLAVSALDAQGNLLSSVIAAANTDGTTGTSSLVSLTAASISSLDISGSPGNYVFDDVTLNPGNPSPVPEPLSVVLLLTVIAILSRASPTRICSRGQR
jgi:hypothetical protein